MENNFFVKIPNKLFRAKKDSKNLIEQVKHDAKAIFVFRYLQDAKDRNNIARFSVEDILISSGLKAEKENVSDIKKILKLMVDENLIETDEKDFKPKSFVKCKLNIHDKNNKSEDVNFTKLYDFEYELIMNYNEKFNDSLKLNKLLLLFCYIKSYIYIANKESDRVITGDRLSGTARPKFETINKDIGLSDKSISKYSSALDKLNLMKYVRTEKFEHENIGSRNGVNIYALVENKDVDDNLNVYERLEQAKKEYIKEKAKKGFKCVKNKDSKEMKKLQGEIGHLEKKKKNGIITKEELEQLEEKRRKYDSKEFSSKDTILALLYADYILSDYYQNEEYNEKYLDEAIEAEKKLKLINENEELIVNKKLYKKIMIAYFTNGEIIEINRKGQNNKKYFDKSTGLVNKRKYIDEIRDLASKYKEVYNHKLSSKIFNEITGYETDCLKDAKIKDLKIITERIETYIDLALNNMIV